MPVEFLALHQNLPHFALVVARLAGLIMFQPILASLAIPMPLRALFVLGLSVLVSPLVPPADGLPDTLAGLIVGLGAELLIGAAVGLAGATAFAGLQFGGMLIAQETGLAYGQIVDPTSDEENAVLSAFYVQLGGVLFLIAGGHRVLLSACLDSFAAAPLLADGRGFMGADLALGAISAGMQGAIRVAGPALIALFLVNLAMGFISRTMPQFNVLSFGFALKTTLGFALMAVSLPLVSAAFLDTVETVLEMISVFLRSAA